MPQKASNRKQGQQVSSFTLLACVFPSSGLFIAKSEGNCPNWLSSVKPAAVVLMVSALAFECTFKRVTLTRPVTLPFIGGADLELKYCAEEPTSCIWFALCSNSSLPGVLKQQEFFGCFRVRSSGTLGWPGCECAWMRLRWLVAELGAELHYSGRNETNLGIC